MARSVQVSARDRAREARRRLAARRAERDKMIEDAAAEFFAGQEAVEAGSRDMRSAIVTLFDDAGESTESIADLLGIPTKLVSRLRREAAKEADAPEPSEDTPPEAGAAS